MELVLRKQEIEKIFGVIGITPKNCEILGITRTSGVVPGIRIYFDFKKEE